MTRALSILAVALVALLAPIVHAQAPLPPGWERAQIQPAPLFQTIALACSGDRAYVRDWQGDVRAFDGTEWRAIARAPARGRLIWASPRGRVVVDGATHAYAWDGPSWSPIPVDPWLAQPEHGARNVSAIDGAGESPWLLGRGAVGVDVAGDEGEVLRAFDVASAWYALHDLEVLAHDHVYVAGDAGLLRWNGSGWAIEPTAIEGAVEGVRAFAADDVWAWSGRGVAHFDGRSWSRRDDGLELPGPPPRRSSGAATLHLGGRPDRMYASTRDRVYRFDGSRWEVVLDATHRHPIGRGYGEICATDRFVVVAEQGFALIAR